MFLVFSLLCVVSFRVVAAFVLCCGVWCVCVGLLLNVFALCGVMWLRWCVCCVVVCVVCFVWRGVCVVFVVLGACCCVCYLWLVLCC